MSKSTVDNMQSVSSNAVATLLNTDLDDPSPQTITSQINTNYGIGDVVVYRKSNMVYMYVNGGYTGSPTTSTQSNAVYNIPEKYRPKFQQVVNMAGYNDSDKVSFARGIIEPSGRLDLGEVRWIIGTQIRAGFMYFV